MPGIPLRKKRGRMKSGKRASVDLTLQRSPSGVWTAPGPERRNFRPWQRLWLVTGIVYLGLLGAGWHLLMPDRERIERQMIQAVTEEVRRYDGMAFAGESPRKIFENARAKGYAAWIGGVRSQYHIGQEGNAGFARIDREYREALARLPMKRAVAGLICLIVWTVPMAALYGAGAVIDWIRRDARIT